MNHPPNCKKISFTLGICECMKGFQGENCAIKVCPRNDEGNSCSGRGHCEDGENVCVCEDGWRGKACELRY